MNRISILKTCVAVLAVTGGVRLACAQPEGGPGPAATPSTAGAAGTTGTIGTTGTNPPAALPQLDELCDHRLECKKGTEVPSPWRFDNVGMTEQDELVYRLEVCHQNHEKHGAQLVLVSKGSDGFGNPAAVFQLLHHSLDKIVPGTGMAVSHVSLSGNPEYARAILQDGCSTNTIRNEQAGDLTPYVCSATAKCSESVVCP